MEQLTESNWKQNFENVISNCKNKGEQLEKIACEQDGKDMVKTYKKFGDEASNKYNNYQSKPFNDSKRSIGEDMSFYQQQCNSNYGLLSNFIKNKCEKQSNNNNVLQSNFIKKSKSLFSNTLIFLSVLFLVGLVLILIGYFIKNDIIKIILNIIGCILLVFVFAKIIIKLLRYFGII